MNKLELTEDMLINSFRYCLGRKTYVVSDFVHEAIPILHRISRYGRSLMIREIESCKDLGMEMDKAEWLRFKVALEKSLE
jgi:hypothetical protein